MSFLIDELNRFYTNIKYMFQDSLLNRISKIRCNSMLSHLDNCSSKSNTSAFVKLTWHWFIGLLFVKYLLMDKFNSLKRVASINLEFVFFLLLSINHIVSTHIMNNYGYTYVNIASSLIFKCFDYFYRKYLSYLQWAVILVLYGVLHPILVAFFW